MLNTHLFAFLFLLSPIITLIYLSEVANFVPSSKHCLQKLLVFFRFGQFIR